MKTALVTIAIGDRYKRIAEVTHPTLKKYADKIGSDFVVLDEPGDFPHWEKFKIYDLLIDYNRILYIDTDIIIREDCPNLFDIVSEDKLGMFNEGQFEPREDSIKEAVCEYKKNIEKWDGSYYNTGVIVVSRRHRSLFKVPEKKVNLGMWEQPYINLEILANKIPIQELDYRFNRMTLMDKVLGITRLDSYIVHYAGAPEQLDLISMIKEDIDSWKNDSPDFKYERNVVLYAGGGMGDQLASEPVMRFVIKNMFKDVKTNYYVISNWPRLFQHLNVISVTREDFDKINLGDICLKVMKSLPSPEESVIWKVWSHVLAHTTDYASVSMICKTLPEEDKTICLKPSLEGIQEVLEINKSIDNEMILVHPGRGWASKTFPASWWNDVIKGLIDGGKTVGIIGKHISKEQGYVDVDVPEGAVDFRDMLSLDGLIAAISMSKAVVSNDSAPIHIAGAFDNYIFLIATCKHPDHVLPYRKGNKHYKAYSFAKKLTLEDWDYSPTSINKETADKISGDILEYIPEPSEVVKKVLELT